jgi:TetR/AcrR family transcriptional regulator
MRGDIDPAALSLMIFGLILFWVENRAHFAERFQGRMDDDTYFRQAVSFVERGIAPSKGKPITPRQSTRPAPLHDDA